MKWTVPFITDWSAGFGKDAIIKKAGYGNGRKGSRKVFFGLKVDPDIIGCETFPKPFPAYLFPQDGVLAPNEGLSEDFISFAVHCLQTMDLSSFSLLESWSFRSAAGVPLRLE